MAALLDSGTAYVVVKCFGECGLNWKYRNNEGWFTSGGYG